MRSFPFGAAMAIGLGLVLAPGLVGLPLLAYGVGEILGWSHGIDPTPATTSRRLSAGWIATVLLGGAVIVGIAIGVCSIEGVLELVGDDDAAAVGIVATASPLFAGLLFAPFALLPTIALVGASGRLWVDGIWLAAHRGAARTALLGAMLGSLGALPFALAVALGVMIDDALVPLGLLAGVALDVALAGAVLGAVTRAGVDARERVEDAARHPAALSSTGRLGIVPLGLFAAVLALASLTPLPLADAPALGDGSGLPTEENRTFRVPGTDIELALGDWRMVEVRTEHGETRQYRHPHYLTAERVLIARGTQGGREVVHLVIGNDWDAVSLLLDARTGERLGDGVLDRIVDRMPRSAWLALVLACALGVVFWVRAGRAQARARAIARVAAGEASGDLVRGELRVRGAPVIAERGAMRGAGGAWVEAEQGALRIALPDVATEVLAIDPSLPRELPEGTPIVLVTQGARLGGVGLRDASVPWPAGTLAVIGDVPRAAAAGVRRTFPSVLGIGVAIGALLVLASLALASTLG